MMKRQVNYSSPQLSVLVALRVVIGWHFLYEGLVKVLNPTWTAFAYLMDSQGFMSSFFKNLAQGSALHTVNLMNEWGLVIIGLGLILGIYTRFSCLSAILLLCFYYLSHPAFLGAASMMPTEGSYFLVDKNIIEIVALLVLLVFPAGNIVGFDAFLLRKNKSH